MSDPNAKAYATLSRIWGSPWSVVLKLLTEEFKAAEAKLAEAVRERDELKRQLTFQRDNNHERNVELDALHYVWCNGGCVGGTHRFTPGEVTEEVVAAAERNTKRLRQWWGNKQARDARARPSPAPTEPAPAFPDRPRCFIHPEALCIFPQHCSPEGGCRAGDPSLPFPPTEAPAPGTEQKERP